jgi:proteasome alpha subunit
MVLPYYVSPEQMMQDKAEYAQKGIAKGRSIVAMECAQGVLLLADNPSASLNKISEIYDRIAFAGAGRYSEFENLRKAGIRHADLKGYAYSREDVTAKSLANAYSQTLGTIFSQEIKPLEVEILVAGVSDPARPPTEPLPAGRQGGMAAGGGPGENEIYRITFDGYISVEKGFAVIGGPADRLRVLFKDRYREGLNLEEAVRLAMTCLEEVGGQPLNHRGVEAAVLERTRTGRKFRRLTPAEIAEARS